MTTARVTGDLVDHDAGDQPESGGAGAGTALAPWVSWQAHNSKGDIVGTCSCCPRSDPGLAAGSG